MNIGYIYLIFAIIFEVTGTLMLPISKNFTRPFPSLIIIALYLFSTYLMTFTLDYFPVGIVYAIWSAMGIAIVAIASYYLYSQSIQWQAVIGLILVIAGVILLSLFSSEKKLNNDSNEPKRDSFMEMSDLNKNE